MVKITENMWKTVETRIEKMPSSMKISIGDTTFDKKDLIKRVKKRDEVGELVAEMEINYLKSLKDL